MKKEPSAEDIKLRDKLNKVFLLRLFRNTEEELSDYIDYKLKGNGVTKIAPFAARCIFRELCRETQQQTSSGWDLEVVLEEYEEASVFYCKQIKDSKLKLEEEDIFALLRYYYAKEYQLAPDKAFLEPLATDILQQQIDFPTLLLLILKIFPVYTSHKGDVKNLKADFRKLYLFLKKFVQTDETVIPLPLIDRLEKDFNQLEHPNRIFLLFTAYNMLERYRSYSNTTDLYDSSKKLQNDNLAIDFENTIWVEPEMLSTPTVFWEFVRTDNNEYFLHRYAVNIKAKQTTYESFETIFTDKGEHKGLEFYIIHPEAIISMICQGDRNVVGSHFACEMDNKKAPTTIELLSFVCGEFIEWPFRKLIRLQDPDRIKMVEKWKIPDTYELKYKDPANKYTYLLYPTAITCSAIYLSKNNEGESKEYYRLPKSLNEGLNSITVNDPIGILYARNRAFIYFEFLLLSFEITDKEACARNGVEVVNEIEIGEF